MIYVEIDDDLIYTLFEYQYIAPLRWMVSKITPQSQIAFPISWKYHTRAEDERLIQDPKSKRGS